MKRRDLLKTFSAVPPLGLVSWARVASAGEAGDAGPEIPAERATLSPQQWRILAAVQDRLWPSEPDDPAAAPGAREIRATAYLDRALAAPGFDADVRRALLTGIGRLDDLARERRGSPFPDLDLAAREDLLRETASSGPGERWLATLVAYTLEALLADPLYGGNPGGLGWAWLGHASGRPRPTAANRWERLAERWALQPASGARSGDGPAPEVAPDPAIRPADRPAPAPE